MEKLRENATIRLHDAKASLKEKCHASGWILPKETTSYAPEGKWTNIDLDITPIERRTWTPVSVLGYWISDILSAQSWQIGASVLAIGLTYREAIYCVLLGSIVMAICIAFNGAPGAYLRVPFPVWIRSAFGYQFGRFPVVCRMITALFWHSIQTYTGSTALTVMLAAIWPSYLKIPNHLPASAGITTQGMLSHFLFWSIQLPFLLIRPHKLKWFFVLKAFVCLTAAVGTTIAVCAMAGGSGDIWDQRAEVSGSTKAWLIVYTLNAQTGSWSTVGTNISDFTRYVKSPRNTFWQTIFFPFICFMFALLGIISASASKVVWGEYIWDPLTIASHWTSPAARAGAFYCGFGWVLAQIGVNVSANVISFSNDLTSLCPKYFNLRRSAFIATLIGGWVMVPWKIITGAISLLNFMASLGIFLAPIIAISIADYWIIKRRRVDVPSLYRPHGRYRYAHGLNWRAAVAMLVAIGPAMPSLAHNINTNVDIGGAIYISNMIWYYGIASALIMYVGLSLLFPATESLVSKSEATVLHGEQVAVEEIQAEIGDKMMEKR